MLLDEPPVRLVRRLRTAVRAQDSPGEAVRRGGVQELVEEDLLDPVPPRAAGEPVAEEAAVILRLAGLGDPGGLPAGLGQPERLAAEPPGVLQHLLDGRRDGVPE